MILVTGATGTTGSVVLKELLDCGAPVRALTHSPENADELRALGAEVAVGDLSDPGSLDDAVRGVERMYLVQSPGPDQAAQEINAISAAERAGAYAVVKLGAMGQDPQSGVRFQRVHAEVTEHLQQSSLRWTILQCAGFMQNYLGMAEAVREGRLVSAKPDARVAQVDARDVGAVAARALAEEGHENCTYVLTGPEAITDRGIAAALGAEVVEVGDDDVRAALLAAGYPEWNVEGLIELDAAYRSGAFATPAPDIEALLGRRARSIADFAGDHRAIFQGG
jgi:uncharacterized protein YbjT (DUF2867 family)